MAKIIEEEPLRGGPFGQMQRISTVRRLTPQVSKSKNQTKPNMDI